MATIYGIKNCDTMKKARAWLDKHGVAYDFHDYKTAGIDKATLGALEQEGRLGDVAQSRRHNLPQASGQAERRHRREKAIALMVGSALDDQAAGARSWP